MKPTRDPHETSALIAGIAAFVTWGLVPVYWKLLRFIPATEILAHRFVWTCVFMILLLSWQRRWPEVLANLRSYRTALFCAGSGIAIAINWFVFIWAVNAGHVLETSLGYFMSPLVNVLLGAIFLRERLSRAQLVSVLLASGAVCYLTFGFGRLPWVALSLCLSFGVYGLLRKVSGAASIPGLFLETTLIAPFALGFLLYLAKTGQLHFALASPGLDLLLVSTGIVTGLPLALVRPCGAPSSPDDGRFSPISLAELHLFPRRLRLSRAVSPRSDADFRPHLDRARHIHRRCRHALAFDESIGPPANRNVGQGSCLRFRMSKVQACATFLPHVERR